MVRVHERGSVVGYIVVGVLLAVVVVGGVYLVKHQLQGQLASKSNTTSVATTDKKTPAPESQSPNTTSDNSKSSDTTATSGDKNTAPVSGSTDQSKSSSTGVASTPATSNPTSSATDSATSGSNLPKTGPTSVIGTAAILAMLFGAYIAYKRSLKVS